MKDEYYDAHMYAMAGGTGVHGLVPRLPLEGSPAAVVCFFRMTSAYEYRSRAVEVLSPSTEFHDRVFKFREYGKLESLKEYVLVEQKQPHCWIRRTQIARRTLPCRSTTLRCSLVD